MRNTQPLERSEDSSPRHDPDGAMREPPEMPSCVQSAHKIMRENSQLLFKATKFLDGLTCNNRQEETLGGNACVLSV